MTSSKLLVATIAAAALTLTACGDDGDDPLAAGPASPGVTAGQTSSPVPGGATDAEPSAADVEFSRMMIPHHRQAIAMSDILLAKEGISEEMRTLAEDVTREQGPEIEQMRRWLQEWGEPAGPMGAPGMAGEPEHMGGHVGGQGGDEGGMPMMEGMLSPQEIRELQEAEGTDASRLFLEQMIAHHEGAIDMAQEEVSDGTYPPTVELARSMIETQQLEIDAMREMLAAL
ncbi:DUF305 domain-containing protein [Rhodococcus sp. IEGM 1408]|uniref:DUF305 domain-containing protein n=1 Tax=Rhodococcus sp. IEGM 1408 TaxID=3082220 RepID=UPI002953296C|nr:DUF305 domain-containing protein [Rhodococcus sp. IEGM 1408]MDV8001416.1 DUF305 domain-containing protein [Rhodococcus sp. IEGM 1408]